MTDGIAARRAGCWRVPAWMLVVTLFAWGAVAPANAAETVLPLHRWAWQTWSSESGLPQISVKAMVRDQGGLLWIATENGLARFDGSQFEVFNPGNTPALAASWISRLHVDRQGRVWIGTLRNLVVYDQGRFIASDPKHILGEVTAIAEAADGRLLVGGSSLYAAMVEGDHVHLEPQPTWSEPVRILLADDDALWIAGGQSRLQRRREGQVPEEHRLPAPATLVNGLARSVDGLWLATDAGLYRLIDGQFQLEPAATGGRATLVQALTVDHQQTLWIASYGELYRRYADGRVEHVPNGSAQTFHWTISFFADGDAVWLGSQYHGLRYYWQPPIQRLGADEGLHDPTLWSFSNDGERLLIGSNDGVTAWADGRFRVLIPGRALPHPAVYSLLLDRQRRLWIGTRGGLARVNADGGAIHRFQELDGIQINGAIQTPGGDILLATATGLLQADGDRLQALAEDTELAGQRVRALAYGHDGTLWIGAEGGVFSRRDGRVQRIVEAGVDGAFVTSVLAMRDGRVAIGTYDRGISIGYPDGSWQRLTRERGLPSDTVFNLQEHQGALLVAYSDGVYRLRASAGLLVTPVPFELLVLDEGDRPGRSRTRCCNGAGNDKGILYQGAYWLPSLNGAVRLPLSTVPRPPPEVEIVSASAARQPLDHGRTLSLAKGVRDLAIGYRAIDFRDARQLAYRYRLDGFDADWIEVAGRPPASYVRLPPGQYRFDVQARRTYQAWGPVASVAVKVPKLFVEGWWFRSLAAMAALGLLALLVRLRVRRLHAQKQALEATVHARTRELAEANSQLEALNRNLAEASLIDPLTGLRNRRFLPQQMPKLLAGLRRAREGRRMDLVLGLILVDADRFKQVNDHYGHIIGDQVLCRLARAMRAAVREGDELVRWGGEEFLVVLPDLPRHELMLVAERIRTSIAHCTGAAEDQPCVTASLGVAAWPICADTEQRHDWTVALDLADFALYRAKDAGRNRCAMLLFPDLVATDWPDRPDAICLQQWLHNHQAQMLIVPVAPMAVVAGCGQGA